MHRHALLRGKWWHRRPTTGLRRQPSPPKTADWHRLVEENMKLAYWCAAPFIDGNRCPDWANLMESIALYGLVKAARNYDPEYRTADGRLVKFSTYAVWTVKQNLIREVELLGNRRKCKPLHNVHFEVDQSDAEHERTDASDELDRLIAKAKLTPKQEKAIRLRYGFDLPFTVICLEMGVTAQRVQQMVGAAMEKIRRTAGVDVRKVTEPAQSVPKTDEAIRQTLQNCNRQMGMG